MYNNNIKLILWYSIKLLCYTYSFVFCFSIYYLIFN